MFYSRFECGNLHRVVKKAETEAITFTGLTMTEEEITKKKENDIEHFDFEYDLYLNSDTNAQNGLMHWYYFRVITKNVPIGTKIKLNIRNLHRTISLYEHGMLPRILYAN